MKKILSPLLGVLLTMVACHREFVNPIDPNTPTNSDSSILKLIWKTQMLDGKKYIPPTQPPAFIGNNVAFNRLTEPGDPNDIVVCFDAKTGESKWGFEDPGLLGIYDGESIGDMQSAGGQLALCAWHEVYWIDAESGNFIWKTSANDNGGNGMPRFEVIGDKIYHNRFILSPNDCCEVAHAHLVAAPIETGKWDTIYTVRIDENDNYASSFESYALWLDPTTGDSVLLFQNRQYKWGPTPPIGYGGRIDVLALDLKTRQIRWKTRIPDPIGGSSINNMLVRDGRVYFCSQSLFCCLDAQNGSVLWQKQLNQPQVGYSENLLFGGMAIADGRLILKPDDENFYALDPATGTEIWHRTDAGHSPQHLEIHKDLAIYASSGLGGIWIHRVSDGALLERIDSPHKVTHPGAAFAYSLGIDPKTGLLYVSDGYFAMCYEIKR